MGKLNRSLRTLHASGYARIVTLILLGGLVTVILLALLYRSHVTFEKELVATFQRHQLTTARSLAAAVEEVFAEVEDDLQGLVRHEGIDLPAGHQDYMDAYFETHTDILNNITVVNAEGNATTRSPKTTRKHNVSKWPEFLKVKQTPKPWIGEPAKCVIDPTETVVRIFVPLVADGRFNGAIYTSINLKKLWAKCMKRPETGRKSLCWVVEDCGELLHHANSEYVGLKWEQIEDKWRSSGKAAGVEIDEDTEEVERQLRKRVQDGQEGTAEYVNSLEGVEELVAFTPIRLGNERYGLVVVTQKSQISGPIHAHAKVTYALMAGLAALCVAGGYLVYRGGRARILLAQERKHAGALQQSGKALRQSEGKLLAFMESATEGFVVYDSDLNLSSINKTALQIFPAGSTEEKLKGKHMLDIAPSLKETGRYDEYVKVVKTGDPLFFDDIVPDPRFGDRHLSIHAFRAGDSLGIIFTDITDRKRAEEEIANLAKFPSENPYPVIRIAADGEVLYANTGALGMLEDLESGLGKPAPEQWRRIVSEVLESGSIRRIEAEHRGKVFAFRAVPVPDAGYVNWYGVDVTERKQAEEALHLAARQWETTFDGVADAVCLLDTQAKVLQCNSAMAELAGRRPEECVGRNCCEMVHGSPQHLEGCPLQLARSSLRRETMELAVGGRWLRVTVDPLKDDEGKFAGAVHAVADVTNRKRAEQSLQEARAELQHTIEVVPGIIATANAHTGYFTDCNPALSDILGFSSEEFLARPFIEFIHPDDRQSTIDQVEEQLKGSPVARFENRYICKDGSYKWLEWGATAADEKGVVYAAATDITERKRAEEELEDAHAEVSTILANVPILMVLVDKDRRVQNANDAALAFSRRSAEEIQGLCGGEALRCLYALDDPKGCGYGPCCDSCVVRNTVLDTFETGESHQGAKTRLPFMIGGKQRELDLSVSTVLLRVKGEQRVRVCSDESTERKRAEEEIANLAKFPAENPDPVLRVAGDGTIAFANKAAGPLLDAWSCRVDQALPKQWAELVAGVVVSGAREDVEIECDGRIFLITFAPVVEAGYVNLYARDITDRKQMEEEQQIQSEITANMSEGVYLVRLNDGVIIYTNPKFDEIFGYSPGEMAGKHVSIVNAPTEKTAEETATEIMGVLDKHGSWEGEINNIKKDGTPFWSYASVSVFHHPEHGRVLVSVHLDITERKRMEESLGLSHVCLEVAYKERDPALLLREFVAKVQAFTHCAGVGIRLLDEKGNIPYEAHTGFEERFYESESPLSIKSDECMCINVIKGDTDPSLPFYTEGGSFYMNATTRFLGTVSQEDKGQTRNVCNKFGYESVALVPIASEGRIVGLIHVADPKENMVPLEAVNVLEKTAMQLGTAIQRVAAELDVRRSHKELRALAARLQDAREEERILLARKFHDDVGHNLAALKRELAWLGGKLPKAAGASRTPNLGDRLKSMSKLLAETIQTARETASDLRPGLLDDVGLAAAIEWEAKQFQRRTGVKCRFTDTAGQTQFDREQSTALFRICQELLANIANHAGATAVTIDLKKQADELVLKVSDNGKGIRDKQISSARSLGILGMRERALVLGGAFSISGKPGKGTTATVQIPLIAPARTRGK